MGVLLIVPVPDIGFVRIDRLIDRCGAVGDKGSLYFNWVSFVFYFPYLSLIFWDLVA